MGYSKAQKEKTHKRIVAIASKRFREQGLAGFGIAELMKEAGLTVGGFYKHFDSRDELVVEAVSAAFGIWQRQKEAAGSGGHLMTTSTAYCHATQKLFPRRASQARLWKRCDRKPRRRRRYRSHGSGLYQE